MKRNVQYATIVVAANNNNNSKMIAIQAGVHCDKDNGDVMWAAHDLLSTAGKAGLDYLQDCLNDAYEEDMKVSKGKDTTGRASLQEVVDVLSNGGVWHDDLKILLLTGMMRRAIALKLL